ncbi:MAG: hypothetical protein OHK93_000776 [Ramalina farinacea]|uniref:BSD domain-containing protein n=1 Tax=Ramalina farinacea TaxID=258253 RepID=A0AA43QPZ0_9LECA|nr:hypothetical protein [Ramalina farinacea]
MDIAYDHIQEEVLTPEQQQAAKQNPSSDTNNPPSNLNSEFREAYTAFSASPWGAKLGGFFSDVSKKSTTLYDGARQEANAAMAQEGGAFRGLADLRQTLVSRARSMSSGAETVKEANSEADGEKDTSETAGRVEGGEKTGVSKASGGDDDGSAFSKFRAEATKRLRDLEKAEEAADAAIFRFGANVGAFLKDAVSIAPPSSDQAKSADGKDKILFESKSEDGKRVIHSTRLEAQLYAIHTSPDKFSHDPEGDAFGKWIEETGPTREKLVEARTDQIAGDLERFEELRKMMERSMGPEGQVTYADFWTRYYFLRMVVEADEKRRKEVLKGATLPDSSESISWDNDSDSDNDEDTSSTPQQHHSTKSGPSHPYIPGNASPASQTTITEDPSAPISNPDHLKPTEPRRSQDEKSQPDSDASYDLVSGATSRAPGSPRKGDEEDEEDWE